MYLEIFWLLSISLFSLGLSWLIAIIVPFQADFVVKNSSNAPIERFQERAATVSMNNLLQEVTCEAVILLSNIYFGATLLNTYFHAKKDQTQCPLSRVVWDARRLLLSVKFNISGLCKTLIQFTAISLFLSEDLTAFCNQLKQVVCLRRKMM